ncbi:hypothetical protein U3516DRAFT_868175 [Neocallimastix sp. 'constans']
MSNSTIKIIKSLFEINEDNRFLIDKDFYDKIENHELFKNNKKNNNEKIKLKDLNKDDIYIRLYVVAIDYEDIEFFN